MDGDLIHDAAQSPCTSLCGGGDWAAAARTLTVVTTGTTQPARISARRVKSCRLLRQVQVVVITLRRVIPSSVVAHAFLQAAIPVRVRSSAIRASAAVPPWLTDSTASPARSARPAKSVVAREPLAVCVDEQTLEMAAQPLPQPLGRGLVDFEQPAGHQDDEAVDRVGVERESARTCCRRRKFTANAGCSRRACSSFAVVRVDAERNDVRSGRRRSSSAARRCRSRDRSPSRSRRSRSIASSTIGRCASSMAARALNPLSLAYHSGGAVWSAIGASRPLRKASECVMPGRSGVRNGKPRPAAPRREHGAPRRRTTNSWPVASVRVEALSTGVFTSAMPCSADQDAGQFRISSSHSISAPCPSSRPSAMSVLAKSTVARQANEHGRCGTARGPIQRHRMLAWNGALSVDLDQVAGRVDATAVGRHRPRRVDAARRSPRSSRKNAMQQSGNPSRRPIVPSSPLSMAGFSAATSASAPTATRYSKGSPTRGAIDVLA